MSSPHPDDNELALLVDGSVDAMTRDRLERHLDDCPVCSELVAELAWVVAPAREAPPGYRLVRELDARTWEAIDLEHDERRVAIGFGGTWPDALLRVRHPAVAVVHAMGEHAGERYLVHELGTRSARLWHAEVGPDEPALLRAWSQVLEGLAALHAAGIVHGRVTPDHVFVEPDGRVFLGAFAREVGKTSGYLAAEQLAGEPATARSDQVGACASLWELLAGSRPFTGSTPGALAVVMSTPPDPPAHGDRRVFSILGRGLAAEPARRWPDIRALATSLAGGVAGRRPWQLVAVLGVVVLVVAVVILIARG